MARTGMANIITKIRDTINDPYVSIAMSNNEATTMTVIELASTTGLSAGDLITLEDSASSEQTTITSLIADTSITVPAITNSYTTAAAAKVTKGDPIFSDNKLQEFCDEHRKHIDYEELYTDEDYKHMWHDEKYFDTDSGLFDGTDDSATEITAGVSDSFDYITTRFVFNTAQTETYYIKGYRYIFNLIIARCYREMAENPDLLLKYKSVKKGSATYTQKDCFDISDYWQKLYDKSLGLNVAGGEKRYD